MNILAAIKREERKLEKQLGRLQHELDGMRTAAQELGRSTSDRPAVRPSPRRTETNSDTWLPD